MATVILSKNLNPYDYLIFLYAIRFTSGASGVIMGFLRVWNDIKFKKKKTTFEIFGNLDCESNACQGYITEFFLKENNIWCFLLDEA